VYVNSSGSDSGFNIGIKGVPERPFATVQGANTVANPGDWVIVTGATIQTNNLLKAGVNYDIYPKIIYMETANSNPGYGIFDDRSIPAGTTNIIICHDDIKWSQGTNLGRIPYLGNDNCMGAIVTTNSNTRLTFYGKDIYASAYDASSSDRINAINIWAGSEDSFYSFNNIYSFATNMVGTNQFGTPTTTIDQCSGVQVFSNGCKMVCYGEINPYGAYSIISTADDPNINANFYFDGAAKLKRKIYASWASPNWRWWIKCFEINTTGQPQGDAASLYGAGKVYIEAQKISSDFGILVNTQTAAGGTATNIDVWVKAFKLEASGACTSYAEARAGKLRLDVDTYTNLDNSVTAGFHTIGGSLEVNGGTMTINAQQAFGVQLDSGTNYIKDLKIVNNLVNHAGNNCITNAGGAGSVMKLANVTLVGPLLAQGIAAGAAATVQVKDVLASNTNSSNVTLSPNGGFTVDPLTK